MHGKMDCMLNDHFKSPPYPLHTNRELGLMLRGEKPLSVFSDAYGHFPEAVLRYLRMFDAHVDRGIFLKREYVSLESGNRPGTHVICYALPGQEWRIDAIIELRKKLEAWNSELERTEGSLLGYSDWQNDWWIERYNARR
jgi:hypothetical protein